MQVCERCWHLIQLPANKQVAIQLAYSRHHCLLSKQEDVHLSLLDIANSCNLEIPAELGVQKS